MHKNSGPCDAIVIGSGIGGLACACALTRSGLKVRVLERHFAAGGLSQTFHRNGFRWAVGVHYLGDMGERGSARRVLDWLSRGAIHFTPAGRTLAFTGWKRVRPKIVYQNFLTTVGASRGATRDSCWDVRSLPLPLAEACGATIDCGGHSPKPE